MPCSGAIIMARCWHWFQPSWEPISGPGCAWFCFRLPAKPDPPPSSRLRLKILDAVQPDVSVFAVQFDRSQSSGELGAVLILEGDHYLSRLIHITDSAFERHRRQAFGKTRGMVILERN